MLIVRASSNAELSLTPRYAEVTVTEDCPSNRLTASTLWVFAYITEGLVFRNECVEYCDTSSTPNFFIHPFTILAYC